MQAMRIVAAHAADDRAGFIEIAGLGKRYPVRGGAPVTALADINLKIAEGEFVCVVGPSGCGKSTLLKIVAGIVPSYEGAVSLDGRRIAVLGLAFKPDSDDVRDSPALHVAQALRRAGAEVRAYDPQAVPTARRIDPGLTYAANAQDACRGADLVLHLTEWQEFRELEPAALAQLVSSACILDARNALDAEAWRAAGWQYHAPGRPDGQ